MISGVTSGIGEALYGAYADLGYTVSGCGRRADLLAALKEKHGGIVEVVDVGCSESVAAWADSLVSAHGPPVVVIANAGISPSVAATCPAWETPPDIFADMVRVNVLGVHHLAAAFLPKMIQNGRGAFIAISSGLGRSTASRKGAYSATKFAVEAYTKSVAQGLPSPLVAIPLAPGILRTEMNDDPSMPTPDVWVRDAVPFIESLVAKSRKSTVEENTDRDAVNGSSLSVEGYYTQDYRNLWIIQDGQPLKSS